MKTAIVAILTALTIVSTAAAKKAKVDFTPFKGAYSGTYLINASGMTYAAPIKIKVNVPKSGNVLTLVPSGVLSTGTDSYIIGGSLALGPGKKAQLNSIFFLPTLYSTFGIGSFSGKKANFPVVIVTQVDSQTLVTTGTLSFRKKSLQLTMLTSAGSSTYQITISARKKK